MYNNIITRGLSKTKNHLMARGFALIKVLASVAGSWLTPFKRRHFHKELPVLGTKLFGYTDYYRVLGDRMIPVSYGIDVEGIKQTRFDTDIAVMITGSKSFKLHEEVLLGGTKSIPLAESVEVSGKRDLTPILVALDLID